MGQARKASARTAKMAIFHFSLVTFVTLNFCFPVSFNRFGLLPEVVRGTQAMGFVEPTRFSFARFRLSLPEKI